MHFRQALVRRSRPRREPLLWVSQVSVRSVGIRCPQPPRKVRLLHTLVASQTMAGFAISGRLATFKLRNEAESGSRFRITADAFASAGFDDEVANHRRRSRYMLNEQFTWFVPLNELDQTK